MKFAVVALLASTSAIKMNKGKRECVSHEQAVEGFRALDTNHDGSLSYDEIKVGLEDLAASQNYTITDADWKWAKETGAKIDTATPGKVDEEEFYEFANALFRHYKICHLARE